MLDVNKNTLLGTCLHPVRIYSKYTHHYESVACGQCEACLNAKASKLSMRVSEEIKQHKYSLFFTLTYNNEYVPKFEVFQDDNNVIQLKPVERLTEINQKGEMLAKSCPINKFDDVTKEYTFQDDIVIPKIEKHNNLYQFGVVSKADIQNFLKRLRDRINKLNIPKNEKAIRYFICSEYGPTTIRPHYHGIIFFDSQKLLDKIKTLIIMSWGRYERRTGKRNSFKFRPFANTARTYEHMRLCDANTSYYVAEYIAGNSRLPQVLQLRETKPFHMASKNPVIGCFKNDSERVLEAIERGDYTEDKLVYDEKTQQISKITVPLSKDVLCALFSKCYGYRDYAHDAKRAIYTFYRDKYEEWKKVIKTEILTACNSTSYDNYKNFNKNLIGTFLYNNPHFKFRNWCASQYSDDYIRYNFDKDATWYASKKAYKIAYKYDIFTRYYHIDPIHCYLSYFEKYLHLREQFRLKEFYNFQDDLIKHIGIKQAIAHCYPTMYDDIKQANFETKIYAEYEDNYIYAVQHFLKKRQRGEEFVKDKIINQINFEDSEYYKTACKIVYKKTLDRTKQKKINNTNIFGACKIE